MTHEAYLQAIVQAVAEYAPYHADRLRSVKLVYGTGHGQRRLLPATHHGAWKNAAPVPVVVVEVCAFAQDAPSQVAATAVHELAHALLGPSQGHDATWKRYARRLGMVAPRATSDGAETWAAFVEPLRSILEAIPTVTNDRRPLPPAPAQSGPTTTPRPRPCSAGAGARDGTSRGAGSGSRQRKVQCEQCGYICRVSARWLAVGAPVCPVDGHGPMVAPE